MLWGQAGIKMKMFRKKISRIRTGGQSGVDRAAMDFAREREIPLCGWCPKNGWAEDYPDPPGLIVDYPELTETQGKDLGKLMYTAVGLEDVPGIIRWINDLPDDSELCIGGPRASECADAYNLTKAILDQIAEAFGLKQALEQS